MGEETKIQWCDHTFNPWWGCTKVSPGCTNCYANALDKRTGGDHWGVGKERRRTSLKNWQEPRKWNADAAKSGIRKRVFCASMADWLDDAVPDAWRADLLNLIHQTPHLDWLLLTKRPENWRKALACAPLRPLEHVGADVMVREWLSGSPPRNVWIGTSVEDQRRADERIPLLLQIPAVCRFLSCEPLLGPVNLSAVPTIDVKIPPTDRTGVALGWIIIGGESGGGARLLDIGWVRSLAEQAVRESQGDCAVFVKQLGPAPREARGFWCDQCGGSGGSFCKVDDDGCCTGCGQDAVELPESEWELVPLQLKDRKGGDMAEWPEDLRVRQFPVVL